MIIDVQNVNKKFNNVQALKNVDIQVPAGQITVLLGPNGAGKTTAIRAITGAITPDTGKVLVFGMSPEGPDGEKVRRKCGVVTAKPSLYDRLTGKDNLLYSAKLFGMQNNHETISRIHEAAEQFGIEKSLNNQVGGYSTGMKTRLALSRAVLHKPDLLLLDEPTSGLDPESAAAVLKLIKDMAKNGQSVLMCTHLLLEAEGLADRIIIMEEGETIIEGAPDELALAYWQNYQVALATEHIEDLDQLATYPGVINYVRNETSATFELTNKTITSELIFELARQNIKIHEVIPYKPSLEDLYFAIRQDLSKLGNHLQKNNEYKYEKI